MTIPFTDPIEDAIIQWRNGEASRIDACYTLVANNCSTAEFANRSGLDADTVGKMVQAGKQYRALLEHDEDLACDVRRELTYSHLALVYRYVSVAGILTAEQGTEYLRLAIWERLSVRKLDAKIRADFQLGNDKEFGEVVRGYIGKLDRDLINTPLLGMSEDARDYASDVIRPRAADLLEALEVFDSMVSAEKEKQNA